MKAKEEAKRKAELEAKRKAERDSIQKADEEARLKAKNEVDTTKLTDEERQNKEYKSKKIKQKGLSGIVH